MRHALLLLPLLAPLAGAQDAAAQRRPIDLAICLDTSGSMDGLIDSARRKIWAVVNDLAVAKPTPRLRVALLTYGNDGHDAAEGWVRIHQDFTEDLDAISQALFGFTTNGGTELVGRVLKTSLEKLAWTPGTGHLKLIVVAGNESADQDQAAPFRDVCRAAIAKGIQVNPIYCVRAEDAGIQDGWKEIARLADGHFAAIDQNSTVDLATPFDARLAELSTALNGTYVPFGEAGAAGKASQVREDANAQQLEGGADADRANAKSGRLYTCRWCLVDATRNKDVKLEDLKDEDLPEALRGKTLEEKKTYLAEMLQKREGIQKEVAQVQAKRQEWLTAELAKRGAGADQAFDAAVRRALREQASAKGFEFDK
jgi:hypothetical protein